MSDYCDYCGTMLIVDLPYGAPSWANKSHKFDDLRFCSMACSEEYFEDLIPPETDEQFCRSVFIQAVGKQNSITYNDLKLNKRLSDEDINQYIYKSKDGHYINLKLHSKEQYLHVIVVDKKLNLDGVKVMKSDSLVDSKNIQDFSLPLSEYEPF